MAEIREELTLIDRFTQVFNNFISLGNAAATQSEAVQAAVDGVDQASSTAASNASNTVASYTAAADAISYWTDKVGNYDKSAMEATYTTQELVKQGYKTAEALVAEQQAAEAAAAAQEAVAEATRMDAERQQALAQTIQNEAVTAYEAVNEVLNAGLTPMQQYERQIKQVESALKSNATKLQEAATSYTDIVSNQGAASDAAEKQGQKVEQLTGKINGLLRLQDELNKKLKEASEGHEEAGDKAKKHGEEADKAANGGLNKMLGKLLKLAAIYSSIRKMGDLVSNAMKESNYEVKFQATFGDDAVGTAAMDYARRTANEYGRTTSEVAKATSEFMKVSTQPANLDKFNALTDKLAVFSEGNSFGQMGDALQRAFMSGSTGLLASTTNISKGILEKFKVEELIKSGKVSEALDALEKAAEAAGMTGEAYNKMLDSPQKKWDKFVNGMKNGADQAAGGFVRAFAPAFDKLEQWVSSDKAQIFFKALEEAASVAAIGVGYVVDGIMWLVNLAMDNLPILAGLFIALGVAALVAGFQAFAAWVTATWPILLIIGIIVVLVLAFYNLIDIINEWTGSTISATGIIMGAIFALAAFIYNTFIVILWNGIAEFINFFANVFKDPVASIKLLFLGLSETVLGYIANIARGIEDLLNKIPGISVNMTSGLDNLLENVKSAAQSVKDASEWTEVAKKLDQWDYKEAATQGYGLGAKIDKKLSSISLEGLMGNMASGSNDPFMNYDGIDKVGSIGKVGEVGKIKDDVSLADEDLKMLVDLSERQYVALVNLTVPQTNATVNQNNYGGGGPDNTDAMIKALSNVLGTQHASSSNVAIG
ncbi:hypothetical protein [Lacrimispora sp.]|uniref:hypothetical protein n=1 Tax=Lacrimispora sp. TaxID=2719234 RepID=UPI0028AF1E3D|nr:hypothetical protein [Lacrimispora sp.]